MAHDELSRVLVVMHPGDPSALHRARQVKHRFFVARRGARARFEGLAYRARKRSVLERAFREIRLPPLPRAARGEVWAIAMVRNEEDVLAGTLSQLTAQGVDRIIVVDNASTDGTRDLLASCARTHPLIVGDDRWAAYEQSAKMTVLADHVRRAGAGWVVPFDADERWMGQNGTIADVLHRARAPIVLAELVNAFPDPDVAGSWKLDPAPHHDPKVAFRSSRGAVIAMGNHRALRSGDIAQGLGIVHLPWRSFEQFREKVRHGASVIGAADLPDDAGWHWRRLGAMDDGELTSVWEQILRGEQVPENAWHRGPGAVPFTVSGPLAWGDVERARRGR